MRHRDGWRAQRFYRDPYQRKLLGVCAGLADYVGWNTTATRILAIIALLWFNVTALIAYLALGLILPTKPAERGCWCTGEAHRRGARHAAHDTVHDVRHDLREPDMTLQHTNGYVTSGRYDLDRQFRDLED